MPEIDRNERIALDLLKVALKDQAVPVEKTLEYYVECYKVVTNREET